MNLIFNLESLIKDYMVLIENEEMLARDRIELMEAFLDVYQTQDNLDICQFPSYEEKIYINEKNYTFYFDEYNQIIKVEKNQ